MDKESATKKIVNCCIALSKEKYKDKTKEGVYDGISITDRVNMFPIYKEILKENDLDHLFSLVASTKYEYNKMFYCTVIRCK